MDYLTFFKQLNITFVEETPDSRANYWLNVIALADREERDSFLAYSTANGVLCRPVWELMHRLPMFSAAEKTAQPNSEWLADRLVNLPSSVRIDK